eukprot:365289-Chlamydomonas_euryale.AAC.29
MLQRRRAYAYYTQQAFHRTPHAASRSAERMGAVLRVRGSSIWDGHLAEKASPHRKASCALCSGRSKTHSAPRTIAAAAPDEDDVRLADVLVRVSGKEQVPAARALDHLVEAGLVNGQRVRVPGRNARLINVHDCYSNVGALGRNHGHGRACGGGACARHGVFAKPRPDAHPWAPPGAAAQVAELPNSWPALGLLVKVNPGCPGGASAPSRA